MLNAIKKQVKELIEAYRYEFNESYRYDELNDDIILDDIKANINLIIQDVDIPFQCVAVRPTEIEHKINIVIERRK